MPKRPKPLVLTTRDLTPHDLHPVRDSWNREAWIRPAQVDAAKAVGTRFGRRILVYVAGNECWLRDTPANREALALGLE